MLIDRRRALVILGPAAALALTAAQTAKADPAAGQTVFAQHCAICHSTKTGEIIAGPSLAGVVGRKVGSVSGFPYSSAMKTAGGTWTPAALDTFVTMPRRAVPKTNMAFTGLPNAQQRADLVAYLATLK